MRFLLILISSMAIGCGLGMGVSKRRLLSVRGGFRKEQPTSPYSSSLDSSSASSGKVHGSSRNLKKIIQELEESDYGSFGSYGNFKKQRKKENAPADGDDSDYQVVNLGNKFGNRRDELNQVAVYYEQPNMDSIVNTVESLCHSPQIMNLSSTFKLIMICILGGCLSYISIVPRNAFVEDYNKMFKETLLRLLLSSIWPTFLMWLLFEEKDANVNQVVDSFVKSFFQLYPTVCTIELILVTVSRIAILNVFEPNVFNLFPNTPSIILPWTLHQHGYITRRITMYMFSFINGCCIGPIIEEFFKIRMLRHVMKNLGHDKKRDMSHKSKLGEKLKNAKNSLHSAPPTSSAFQFTSFGRSKTASKTKTNGNNQSTPKTTKSHEATDASDASFKMFNEGLNAQPITVRSHIIHMAAISLGLKVADNCRRILLYNAPTDRYKTFFAISRSVFPVQELCGILTALARAEENLLFEENVHQKENYKNKRSLWKVLGPAVLLHIMANFRGMKPLYVWASKNPWDEIQIQALGAPDHASAAELVAKCGLNLLWFMLLFRTIGYTTKKYVDVSRIFYLHLLEKGMSLSA